METTFSIFNQAGENVEGKVFDSIERAQLFLETNDYSEFGENIHAGQNCPSHDEGEFGNCPFCNDSLAGLSLKCDSELAVVYAKAGLSQAGFFAEKAATAAFTLIPALRA